MLWQALGLAVCIGDGLATGWVLKVVLEAMTGLGVPEDVQVAGYDARYWDIVHDLEPAPPATAVGQERPVVIGATDREPTPR